MARNRTISPDFWTCEAVIDCQPMTRLLFIGLQNFADDGGVQPLRPRTIRLQVFPGDTIENDSVRAMIDELAARKLVRIYSVEGVEYVAIVDWDQLQRVGKRARRRYPPDASVVPGVGETGEQPAPATADHSNVETPPSPSPGLRPPPPPETGMPLREVWPEGRPMDALAASRIGDKLTPPADAGTSPRAGC